MPNDIKNGTKIPKLHEALGISESTLDLLTVGYRCPALVYCLWKSGRHALMNLKCKSWRCVRCAKEKIYEMTQYLADATFDHDLVCELEITKKQTDAVTRYLRKIKAPTLTIRFADSTYIVTDREASGRGWATQPILRLEALVKVNTVDIVNIRRRDFTQSWRPEETYEPRRDTVVLSKKFDNIKQAKRELESFGQNIDKDVIEGDPLDLLDRMIKTSGSFKLQFVETGGTGDGA